MSNPTKDDVLKDLIEFFLEEESNDPKGVLDWLVQGNWDANDFMAAVQKLKTELALRD